LFRILKRDLLGPHLLQYTVEAPEIAKAARAGQYVIVRAEKGGERIPLVLTDFDPAAGSISFLCRPLGPVTQYLERFFENDELPEISGPFGNPAPIEAGLSYAVIGGGMGALMSYPIARALREQNCAVDLLLGFHNKSQVVLEEQFRSACDHFFCCTDDGSYGQKGMVSRFLENRLDTGVRYDRIYMLGPIVMMKFVSHVGKRHGIKTIMSMNPIMMDGTGMCGGCELLLNGKKVFACQDGPDFDASQVDFDALLRDSAGYRDYERHPHDDACHLLRKALPR
jgi:ferredoxin--NADP+ reductase